MSSTNSQKQIKYGNCYTDFPELYDVLYKRYFKSIPTFIDLISKNTQARAAILDIAAGTGEVTIPLLRAGFAITSLDLNQGMLDVLVSKATKENLNASTICADMRDLPNDKKYATVCTRQAINYNLTSDELKHTFTNIFNILNPGGSLIFNAPNFQISSPVHYPDVENRYDTDDGWHVFVIEQNTLEDRLLTHEQEAIIWQENIKPAHISDVNQFYMFTKEEFESCLKQVGFHRIEFYSSNLSTYNQSDKTLYGVATK